MLHRQHYLMDRKTLDDSGTETIDIRTRDPITEMLLHFRMKNGSSHNKGNDVMRNVSAVEVIDGSKVLFSLDGPELLALTCEHYGFLPYQGLSEIPAHVQSMNVVIPFGRFTGDEEYSFDPTRFINPQVRLSWNHSTVRDSTTTSFEDGGVTCSLIADVMEGARRPSHFLMTKEHKVWTTADGTVEYTDLPTDYPYRLMILRVDVAAYALSQLVETIKLNCDAGAFIPFDGRWIDFMREMMNRQPVMKYRHSWNLKNGDTGYCLLKQNEGLVMNHSQPFYAGYYNNYGIGEAAVGLWNTTSGAALTSEVNIFANITGWCPLRTMVHTFGRKDDPATWFPAPNFGNCRLEVKGESAAATAYVALQQPVPY